MGLDARKTYLRGLANNKGAGQPAHDQRSLISAFVICLLESISKLATSKISLLYIVSVAEQADILNTSGLPKRLRQANSTEPDVCFFGSSLIRVAPLCYSVIALIIIILFELKEKSARNFRIFTVCVESTLNKWNPDILICLSLCLCCAYMLLVHIPHLRNDFNFWNVHGIMKTWRLLQS